MAKCVISEFVTDKHYGNNKSIFKLKLNLTILCCHPEQWIEKTDLVIH